MACDELREMVERNASDDSAMVVQPLPPVTSCRPYKIHTCRKKEVAEHTEAYQKKVISTVQVCGTGSPAAAMCILFLFVKTRKLAKMSANRQLG